MTPASWAEIFDALDRAGISEEFLADRGQTTSPQREELFKESASPEETFPQRLKP